MKTKLIAFVLADEKKVALLHGHRVLVLIALIGILFGLATVPRVFAQAIDPIIDMVTSTITTSGNGSDYEGPIGVTGIFNGITTACSYDPLSHNAKRVIDDIVVSGSVGKYPLKMTRYFDSRSQYYAVGIGLGPGWEHEYGWLLWAGSTKVVSPNGATYDYRCADAPVGVSEG